MLGFIIPACAKKFLATTTIKDATSDTDKVHVKPGRHSACVSSMPRAVPGFAPKITLKLILLMATDAMLKTTSVLWGDEDGVVGRPKLFLAATICRGSAWASGVNTLVPARMTECAIGGWLVKQ